jgi:hypothetical protein
MPAQTLITTELADWVLGSTASRGTSARRVPRLDYLRRPFGAIERLEARQVLSTVSVDPPALPPVEDLPVVAELGAMLTQNVAWQSAVF